MAVVWAAYSTSAYLNEFMFKMLSTHKDSQNEFPHLLEYVNFY